LAVVVEQAIFLLKELVVARDEGSASQKAPMDSKEVFTTTPDRYLSGGF
jgi:hypothetical protein